MPETVSAPRYRFVEIFDGAYFICNGLYQADGNYYAEERYYGPCNDGPVDKVPEVTDILTFRALDYYIVADLLPGTYYYIRVDSISQGYYKFEVSPIGVWTIFPEENFYASKEDFLRLLEIVDDIPDWLQNKLLGGWSIGRYYKELLHSLGGPKLRDEVINQVKRAEDADNPTCWYYNFPQHGRIYANLLEGTVFMRLEDKPAQ